MISFVIGLVLSAVFINTIFKAAVMVGIGALVGIALFKQVKILIKEWKK